MLHSGSPDSPCVVQRAPAPASSKSKIQRDKENEFCISKILRFFFPPSSYYPFCFYHTSLPFPPPLHPSEATGYVCRDPRLLSLPRAPTHFLTSLPYIPSLSLTCHTLPACSSFSHTSL
ncbi:hypothetical protein OTU49_007070 [Cherax quadricarinatus]|uniref:Uncharacterized protein n=1 Tax=Cherax quadricarinatus TaxID=27406 RepID=A0AAW0WJS6_CHEQU